MTVMTDSYWGNIGREGCPSRHTLQINNTAYGHSIEIVSKNKLFLSLLKILVVEQETKVEENAFST